MNGVKIPGVAVQVLLMQSDESLGRIIRRIFSAEADKPLSDGEQAIFAVIAKTLEAEAEKREKANEKRRTAMKAIWAAAREQKGPSAKAEVQPPERDTKDTASIEQPVPDPPPAMEGEAEIDLTVKNIWLDVKDKFPPLTQFDDVVPPRSVEIRAWARANGYKLIDPQYFWEYYDKRGWCLKSGGRMKSWQETYKSWMQREIKNPGWASQITGWRKDDDYRPEIDEYIGLGEAEDFYLTEAEIDEKYARRAMAERRKEATKVGA